MKKLLKKLIPAGILALCFTVCMCLFGACADKPKPEDNTETYTVTVRIDETTPAEGVKVQIAKGGATFESKNTDANGKAEFELAPDSYDVKLSNIPAHYNVPESASLSLTAEDKDLTVTLAKNFAYIVKLVNPDGTPYYAEGISVGICTFGGNCLTPVLLEVGGVATIEADKGEYHVKVDGLPENAKIECDADGYYTGENFSATETEMTITVYTVTSVTAATPMTDAEKTAFAKDTSYTADSEITAYHFKERLAKDATAYYSITPAFDGDYAIYYKNGNASNYLFNGTTFTTANNQGIGIFTILSNMQAGKTYYFNVVNNGNATADFEFVIETPSASYNEINLVGEVDVTIAKAGATAIIEYTPAIGAAFKLTGPSDLNTSIVQVSSAGAPANHQTFGKSAVCTARFTEDRVGTTGILYFSVAVEQSAQYPVTFKVKVEKTADLKNTTTQKHATETLSQFAAQEGTLTDIPMDGTANLVYNETDKCYHLNTENGPVVVVSLKADLKSGRFTTVDGGCLAYIDKIDGGRYSLVVDTTADKNSLTAGNTYDDFRLMLRGFAEYNAKPNQLGGVDLEIPEDSDIKEEHYYTKYVNADGVYPLTKELEAFLKAFVAAYPDKVPNTVAEGSEWLFACSYYAAGSTEPSDKDVIVGEYVEETFFNSTKLTVNADGTYTMSEAMGSLSGTWAKNTDGTYTFVENNPTFGPVPYKVTRDAATGVLTFCEENDPEYVLHEFEVAAPATADVIVGEYVQESFGGNTILTVNADGTYTITEAMGSTSGTWEKNTDGTYTFVENNPTFGPVPYTVTRDAATGKLEFYDMENDPDLVVYEFEVSQEQA